MSKSFPQYGFWNLMGSWHWGNGNMFSTITYLEIPTNLHWLYHAWKQTRSMEPNEIRVVKYQNKFIPVIKYSDCFRALGFRDTDNRDDNGPLYNNEAKAKQVAELKRNEF